MMAESVVGENEFRELWERTVGVEVVRRLGLLMVVSAEPYSELSGKTEPKWVKFQAPVKVEKEGQDPETGPNFSPEEARSLVGHVQEEVRGYLTQKLALDRLPKENGIRVHPSRCFRLTQFIWQPEDAVEQGYYLARVLLVFQRLPVADAERHLRQDGYKVEKGVVCG